MRNAIIWLKSNPISVLSIIVVLISLGLIGWIYTRGGVLRAEVEKYSQKRKVLQGYGRQSIDVPPANPDEEPKNYVVCVNGPEITRLKDINAQLQGEYEGIFEVAVNRNRRGKQMLVEGLFPKPPSGAHHLPLDARDNYRRSFEDMMGPADPGVDWGGPQPRLNAGMPPFPEDIQREVEEVYANFMAPRFGNQQATEEEQRDLEKQQRERVEEVLINHASGIGIYAETEIDIQGFPFQVGQWSLDTVSPSMHDLWEGQFELWIQQDIVAAIADANNIDGKRTDDRGLPSPASVLDAPVKRLIAIEVIPGYVGLHTRGAIFDAKSTAGGGRNTAGGYPPPVGGRRTNDDTAARSDNFHVGPTGRVSNALYDVRQARLVAIVDFQQLPALFSSINAVNFMSVIDCKIQDVEEYQDLAEGYHYGSGDAVQVDMLIETIWLRQWTKELLPEKTRQYVGLDEPPVVEGAGGMYDRGYGPGG